MIVTFISQCEKKALPRTRRVLDAFANRIGDNTWQTVITEEGLFSVKNLLRKTSSKNTAVACHRFRTRLRTELIWIVGNRSKFNNQGYVPVNRTQKEVFMDVISDKPKKDEYYANTHLQPLAEHLFSVGYIAQQLFKRVVDNDEYKNLENVTFLAGCWHDVGKIDPEFQAWVKKQKRKDPDDDGQHIDTKFTFEKHPRHNEISLLFFNLFEHQFQTLSSTQKLALQHAIYWHHAKPYRKDNNFTGVSNVYASLLKNIKQPQIEQCINASLMILNKVKQIIHNYGITNSVLENCLTCSNDDHSKLIESFKYLFQNKNFPNFKHYQSSDEFETIRNDIATNAQNNLLRACVISADRLVSSLSAQDLSELISEQRLEQVLLEKLDLNSNLIDHIKNTLTLFQNSARTKKQSEVATDLSQSERTVVLAGAAGCGKTKIALEWAQLKNAQKIIWICPRVQVCQGIFDELISLYVPDANVEIFTGEFKFTNSWENVTAEKDYFSADIVVTTIDQILGSITTHTNVNTLIPFMDAHVIFDEYHEYVNMEIFNLLFAELILNKNMRKEGDKRVLLVSATPHYSYLTKILGLDIEYDVIEMPSFNQSQYQIQFKDYNDTVIENNPFYQPYKEKTFVISNTAKTAQFGFLYEKDNENSVLFHSKFKRSDKKIWFNEVYNSFKKEGSNKYDVLRSGPIVQASLNISCNSMLSEMSSPENILQRLGRLDRFGENQQVNLLTIAITDNIKNGKQINPSAKFLAHFHSLQSAKAWFHYLNEHLERKIFNLPELYQLYKNFYLSNENQRAIQQDLSSAIQSSLTALNAKVTEPVKIIKVKTDVKKMKISKNSLRGDNRFVQLALIDLNDYKNPVYLNEYAYQPPLKDGEEFDNLTESLALITDTGLLHFIAQKHGNIDPSHPVKGIPEKKMGSRHKVLESYARNAEYPLYLSYTEDDLNKVGGNNIRQNFAIYYGICEQQPIGSISKEVLQQFINNN